MKARVLKNYRYNTDLKITLNGRGRPLNGWYKSENRFCGLWTKGFKNIYLHFKNGKLHNDQDEPSVISDYEKIYFKEGLMHRENAPAVVEFGHEEWFKNGVFHNENGPAIAVKSFIKNKNFYYVNGKACSKTELKKLQLIKRLAGLK